LGKKVFLKNFKNNFGEQENFHCEFQVQNKMLHRLCFKPLQIWRSRQTLLKTVERATVFYTSGLFALRAEEFQNSNV